MILVLIIPFCVMFFLEKYAGIGDGLFLMIYVLMSLSALISLPEFFYKLIKKEKQMRLSLVGGVAFLVMLTSLSAFLGLVFA